MVLVAGIILMCFTMWYLIPSINIESTTNLFKDKCQLQKKGETLTIDLQLLY